MSLTLKNPHSVLAAFAVRPRDLVEVRLGSGRPSPAWEDVARTAEEHGVPVVRRAGDRESGRRRRRGSEEGRRTPSAEAVVRERESAPLGELFDTAGLPEGEHGVWLALDHVQDAHNVGAIFRTAAFFGVRGAVVTKDRSAPLNAAAYDVASGGLEHVPFAQQTNLARTLETAKKAGLWVLGTSEHATESLATVERDRHWLVVLGNEERGLRRLTAEHCDVLTAIPGRGPVGSLNVSVAAGIVLAHVAAG